MTARRLVAPAVLVVTIVASGCGSGGADADRSIPRPALEQRVAERLDASPEQARCVVDYLTEDYSAQELRAFHADGIEGLPQSAWESYFTSTIACLTQERPVS